MKISLRSPIPCTPFSMSVGALPKANRGHQRRGLKHKCLEKRSLLTIASAIVSQSQSHGVARGFGTWYSPFVAILCAINLCSVFCKIR